MKKSVLIFSLLIITIIVRAQVTMTINIPTAGTLSALLSSNEKMTVTNLTVIGNIDARDIKCMRDEITVLAVLDLSSATIQAYNGSSGTSDMTYYPSNELPATSFWNVKTSRAKDSLQTIILPNGLISIGDHAFQSCLGMKVLLLPPALTKISSFAFLGCSNITDVIFPSTLKHLALGAFANCIGIKKLYFPDSIITIDLNAFYNCVGLTELTLPIGLSSLGSSAFENCSGITGNVNIPEGLTRIEDNTFKNCQLIDSLTLPSKLSYIGYMAFKDCSSLKTIYCNNPVPPTLGQNNCFTGIIAVTNVYVPTISAYQANTDWIFYFPGNIIKNNSSVNIDHTINQLKIYTSFQGITIDGLIQGEKVKLYDINGIKIYDTTSNGELLIVPVKGNSLYIVIIGSMKFKVMM